MVSAPIFPSLHYSHSWGNPFMGLYQKLRLKFKNFCENVFFPLVFQISTIQWSKAGYIKRIKLLKTLRRRKIPGGSSILSKSLHPLSTWNATFQLISLKKKTFKILQVGKFLYMGIISKSGSIMTIFWEEATRTRNIKIQLIWLEIVARILRKD